MGRVTVAGGNPGMKVPTTGIQAGTLAVGSTVKLMESGTAVEYLVVNQGIPSNSNLYDSSCNGTWLLRKYIHSLRQWNSSDTTDYGNSSVNTWLNGDFFNALGRVEQSVIKQVKIPYYDWNGGNNTSNLSCKVFLLGGCEAGWAKVSYFPTDGAKVDYFIEGEGEIANDKRIAYLNSNRREDWWLRSRITNYDAVHYVTFEGEYSWNPASNSYGIRPALILPSTAKFDATTMLLKG